MRISLKKQGENIYISIKQGVVLNLRGSNFELQEKSSSLELYFSLEKNFRKEGFIDDANSLLTYANSIISVQINNEKIIHKLINRFKVIDLPIYLNIQLKDLIRFPVQPRTDENSIIFYNKEVALKQI